MLSIITLPTGAETDMLASLGTLFSDLWTIIALAIKQYWSQVKNPANSENSQRDNSELNGLMPKCVETIHRAFNQKKLNEDIVRHSRQREITKKRYSFGFLCHSSSHRLDAERTGCSEGLV
jgi:hypothetical protein